MATEHQQQQKEYPRYLAVIFCGGQAKRFGDVKTLGVVAGQPVLEVIIEALNRPVHSPTFVSLGPYAGKRDFDQIEVDLRAAYEKATSGRALNADEKELAATALNAEEVIDFVAYALHLRPMANFAFRTRDDSKASCIKNLTESIKGKITLEDLQTSSPYFNTTDPTFRGYLSYTLDKRVRSNVPLELKERLTTELQEHLAKCKLIVAVNGDTLAINLKDAYRGAISDAFEKLQTQDDAAFIGIFPTAVPKKDGREYLVDANGVVTHISEKDRPNVTEEAGIFIFNPDALAADSISIPKAIRLKPSQRETGKEFLPGPSWLCRELYERGKKVYAKKYAETIFDLNSPEDYFIFRSLIRSKFSDTDDSFIRGNYWSRQS